MIAGLPQLHHNVQQLGLTARPLIDDRRVFCQDVRVPLALHLRHPTPHVDLLLGRDAGVHLCLEAPQHERLQQLMHLLNDVGIGRTFACIVPVGHGGMGVGAGVGVSVGVDLRVGVGMGVGVATLSDVGAGKGASCVLGLAGMVNSNTPPFQRAPC